MFLNIDKEKFIDILSQFLDKFA